MSILLVERAEDLDKEFYKLIKQARKSAKLPVNEGYSEEVAKLPETISEQEIGEELKDTAFVDDSHENMERLELMIHRMVSKRENRLKKDDVVDLYFAGVMKNMVLSPKLLMDYVVHFKDLNKEMSAIGEKGPKVQFEFCLANGEYIMARNSLVDPRFDDYGNFTDQAKNQLGRAEILYSMAASGYKQLNGGRTLVSDALESIHFNGTEKYAKLLSHIDVFRAQEQEDRLQKAVKGEIDQITDRTNIAAVTDHMLDLYNAYKEEPDLGRRKELKGQIIIMEERIQTINPDYKFTPIHE